MSHRRKKHGHEEHHVDERWLVSYADMITVLMALFIVLYAMSTVDQHKFDILKNSLATGFGVTKSKKVDEDKGPVDPRHKVKNGSGFSNSTIPLMAVAKEIQDELKAAGVDGKAQVKTGSNSITVSLVGSSTYFGGNSDVLTHGAKRVLQAVGPSLKKHAGTISVEGHADPRGSAGSFGNDWALGSARSNAVLVWLLKHHVLQAQQMSSSSFGSQGASTSSSIQAIEHNRRVDIVLHSIILASPDPTAEQDTKTASADKKDAGESASTEKKTAEKTASSGKKTSAKVASSEKQTAEKTSPTKTEPSATPATQH